MLSELFKIYKKEVYGPQVKKSSFYYLFKTQFGPKRKNKKNPRIRISKYSSHSRCDLCVQLQEARKKINQPEDLAKVRSLTEAHRTEYSEARIEVNRQMDLALSQPKTWFGMQIDDMDNSKSYLPKLTENYKSLVSTTRLKTKITGCIIVSSLYENNRKCHFFTNHDQFENGSNKVKV